MRLLLPKVSAASWIAVSGSFQRQSTGYLGVRRPSLLRPMRRRQKISFSRLLLSASSSSGTESSVSPAERHTSFVHLNHAGASLPPDSVLQKVVDHMHIEQQIGGYAAAAEAQSELSQVYERIASFIHAKSPSEIALVESNTVAWTRLFYAVAEYQEQRRRDEETKDPGSRKEHRKVILVSEAEYAAQVVPCVQWAKDHPGWTVLGIPSEQLQDGRGTTGKVDLDIFHSMVSGNFTLADGKVLDPETIAVICVTHIPTNSGIVNPVAEIGQAIAGELNKDSSNSHPQAFYLVDACQSIGQMHVNVQVLHCHGLTATGRKYQRAPRGTGFLYRPQALANTLRPCHLDHACAPLSKVPHNVDGPLENTIEFDFRDDARVFEFWESNIASKLGLGEAVRYAMHEVGIEEIQSRIATISNMLQEKLRSIEGISIHHDESALAGIITFVVHDTPAQQVQDWLRTSHRIECSVVPATSTPLDSSKNEVPNLVRASISYMTTEDEIDALCTALKSFANA